MSENNVSAMEIIEVYENLDTAGISNEALIIPKTYIPRSLLQLAPAQPLRGYRRTAVSIQFARPNDDPSLPSSSTPSTHMGIPTTPLRESEILNFWRNRLRFLYALPGLGTTSVMTNQIVGHQQQQQPSKRWMGYMDLRKVIPVILPKGFNDTWTLPKLIIEYNGMTKPEIISEIEGFFKPPEKMEVDGQVTEEGELVAELFLDELDEIQPKFQTDVLKILKRTNWSNCRARVWVAIRPHLRSKIEEIIEQDGNMITSYELLPLTREEQVALLVKSWMMYFPNDPVIIERLTRFATDFHTHMEVHIPPNFFATLGGCPTHMQRLAAHFEGTVIKYMSDQSYTSYKTPIFDFSSVNIIEMFVKGKFDAYLNQWMSELPSSLRPNSEKEKDNLKEAEYRRLQKIHVKFAIDAYDNRYSSKRGTLFQSVHSQEKLEFEVYRLGIMYEMNGGMEFLHPIYAEFLLAQYFTDVGRSKFTPPFYIEFFLHKVLYEDNCKSIRKYLNDYWGVQLERNKMKRTATWPKLRQFLSEHYCLEEKGSEKKVKVGAGCQNKGKEANISKVSYDDIKSFGSVLHLIILERNLHIFEMILNSFRCFPLQLGRLLRIAAPLEIFNDNPFSSSGNFTSETHMVEPFHMLALFGRGEKPFMEQLVGNLLRVFRKCPEPPKYFEEGTWTPLHYAGMSSNHEFLHGLFFNWRKKGPKKNISVNVNLKNPNGQQASHLVLASRCWYYHLKILDHPHRHQFQSILNGNGGGPPPPPSTSVQDNPPIPLPPPPLPLKTTKKHIKKKSKKKKKCTPAHSKQLQILIIKTEEDSKQEVIKIMKDKESLKQSCKEYFAFEGTTKDFIEILDRQFYPSKGQCGYLQSHFSVLRILFRNGGEVNARQDGDGKSLLHLAASNSSPNLVRFLLESGADPRSEDILGMRPGHYAEINGNVEVLLQLVISATELGFAEKEKKDKVKKRKVNGEPV